MYERRQQGLARHLQNSRVFLVFKRREEQVHSRFIKFCGVFGSSFHSKDLGSTNSIFKRDLQLSFPQLKLASVKLVFMFRAAFRLENVRLLTPVM